jgi:hypothetical protein
MENLGTKVPWRAITRFLNGLVTPDAAFLKIEDEPFPTADDGAAPVLPEDYLIRGQVWSQLYYPNRFFKDGLGDSIDEVETRTRRCLWLGVRIATVSFQSFNYSGFGTTD